MAALSAPMPRLMWRVQSFAKSGNPSAICIPYYDSRDVQNRLDEVLGLGGWQARHDSHQSQTGKGSIFCHLGIKINGEWVWRSDCGSPSNVEAQKGESSDAFKRAAVMFGVGRDKYSIPAEKLPADALQGSGKTPNVLGQKGEHFWGAREMSDYINALIEARLTDALAAMAKATTTPAVHKAWAGWASVQRFPAFAAAYEAALVRGEAALAAVPMVATPAPVPAAAAAPAPMSVSVSVASSDTDVVVRITAATTGGALLAIWNQHPEHRETNWFTTALASAKKRLGLSDKMPPPVNAAPTPDRTVEIIDKTTGEVYNQELNGAAPAPAEPAFTGGDVIAAKFQLPSQEQVGEYVRLAMSSTFTSKEQTFHIGAQKGMSSAVMATRILTLTLEVAERQAKNQPAKTQAAKNQSKK